MNSLTPFEQFAIVRGSKCLLTWLPLYRCPGGLSGLQRFEVWRVTKPGVADTALEDRVFGLDAVLCRGCGAKYGGGGTSSRPKMSIECFVISRSTSRAYRQSQSLAGKAIKCIIDR